MTEKEKLEKLAKLVRYYSLVSTTEAGSGHPTSSLSAADLMVGLMFGGAYRYNPDDPAFPNNDRLIFSKGHASPLLYSLWAAAGKVTEQEILTLRKFGSPLEGHLTPEFRFVDIATGSLGQGLSIGVGTAMNAKYLDGLSYRTYVLLGDSEMSEGSQWEAMQIAAHYKLDNLVGIIDVNRLGQRGETMYGHDTADYEKKISAFGWETIVIDGHDFDEITGAFNKASTVSDRPVMVIAKTIKGKGVSFVEDRNGWHGKALSREQLAQALTELGQVDKAVIGEIASPQDLRVPNRATGVAQKILYLADKPVATRKAYGNALVRIFPKVPEMVVLDAEVSNSTHAETFKEKYPERFFEMFIAEQNMAGAALGFASRGKIPFASSFAAFLTRAFDQIRMSQYSRANIKFCGSHAGVSIGEDGPSQMGLEDIAMFRAIFGSVVLYPSDAVSTEKIVEEAAKHKGIVYIRTTRKDTPIIYKANEEFPIGGSKVLKQSDKDAITVAAAGISVHEALAAYEELKKEGILIRVIDLYSVKPLDTSALRKAGSITIAVVVVEDHYPEGGIAEAVRSGLADYDMPVHSLAVTKMPRSGRPDELLDYEEISRSAIFRKVKELL
jgi:transketolase